MRPWGFAAAIAWAMTPAFPAAGVGQAVDVARFAAGVDSLAQAPIEAHRVSGMAIGVV